MNIVKLLVSSILKLYFTQNLETKINNIYCYYNNKMVHLMAYYSLCKLPINGKQVHYSIRLQNVCMDIYAF